MSRVLRIALRLHGADVHPEHLRAALKSRAVVDAAVSLIMAQQRGGRDDALAILQLAAKSTNRRMHDIATDIVRGAGLPQIQRDGE
jgi:AmiR/NasT family two-component response regulator